MCCPFAVGNSTCKRPFDVTENLAFHKVFGNGTTVQRNERILCPFRTTMDCLGGEFLTRTGLTGDKDSRTAGGSIFDNAIDITHVFRPADDVEIHLVGVGTFQINIRGTLKGGRTFDRLGHGVAQLVSSEGF